MLVVAAKYDLSCAFVFLFVLSNVPLFVCGIVSKIVSLGITSEYHIRYCDMTVTIEIVYEIVCACISHSKVWHCLCGWQVPSCITFCISTCSAYLIEKRKVLFYCKHLNVMCTWVMGRLQLYFLHWSVVCIVLLFVLILLLFVLFELFRLFLLFILLVLFCCFLESTSCLCKALFGASSFFLLKQFFIR